MFSASEDCGEENITPVIRKNKSVISSWSQRCLTIKGRVTVATSLLISQLTSIFDYEYTNSRGGFEDYTGTYHEVSMAR